MEKDNQKQTRRNFLKAGGSVLLGAGFVWAAGDRLWKMMAHPEQIFYDAETDRRDKVAAEQTSFVSPYRLTFGFVTPNAISALEIAGRDTIVVGTENNICLYGLDGQLQKEFPIAGGLRDLAFYDGNMYLLFPNHIEVYGLDGREVLKWNACNDDADYCSVTVFEGGVFVTDAANKNICQYRLDGSLSRFIESPAGFIVPSYSFGITNIRGNIFCSNPGRHCVEQYTADGEFVASFGKSGTGAGEFCGCCNPVQLTGTNAGEILTSEKGIPRISCYTLDGKFRSVLLDEKALGGGHVAYDMRVSGDKLIVAGKNKVSVFQYDARRAADTLCGNCEVECPMKANLS